MISTSKRSSGVAAPGPERAVIDIGSNTVRLVIYGGPRRAPMIWLNEKVTARLGRDLAETGRMPDKATDLALRGLARFAAIIEDIGVTQVDVVATAAVRDAENGPEFVEKVRALGLNARVISGEEEARTAAMGVIGAFPQAQGVVADLGGGSLELIAIADGECSHGVSLPLGTLRLPALREQGSAAFRKAIEDELAKAHWASEQEGPLYLVGGTWRALAKFAMNAQDYPLSDPHAYTLSPEEADHFAKQAAQMNAEELAAIPGVSSSRAAGLADACAMLRPLIATLKPRALVFSSWGLREGLLHGQLDPLEREKDPLLSGVEHFTRPRGVTPTQATLIAGWTAATARGGVNEDERLRMAATMLALAAAQIEPNMRLVHCTDWALHKRWLGLDHRGRALIAAALRGACGKPEPTALLKELASSEDLRRAAGWGLAIRLCRRLGAGSRLSLLTSKLTREDDVLTLWIDPAREQLRSGSVESDLKALARWLDLEWRME
ncbi:MAG: hypothetical protein B7Y88_13360 [Sphingomonadales bacterium 32-64-17]|nr:MAG: hypothetical protein B7Y88_13360 [Sphingomonadales bacterium 32-64-17]